MNETDLQAVKDYLLNQKSSILNKNSEFISEQVSHSQAIPDEAEAAAIDASTALSIRLMERDRNSLLLIERALGKIVDGSYGKCELCEQTIDAKRLMVRPFTTFCIDCMEEIESQKKSN
jgi:DnaK suppressor protein